MSTVTTAAPTKRLKEKIEIEGVDLDKPLTLADAIRAGSTVSQQAYNWGEGEKMCALTAAVCAAAAWGYIE